MKKNRKVLEVNGIPCLPSAQVSTVEVTADKISNFLRLEVDACSLGQSDHCGRAQRVSPVPEACSRAMAPENNVDGTLCNVQGR